VQAGWPSLRAAACTDRSIISGRRNILSPSDELDALYAELPRLHCQRKCFECCGPLLIPKIEWKRIEDAGKFVPLANLDTVKLHDWFEFMGKHNLVAMHPDETLSCRLLMPFTGKCTVYAIRPLICRIWGCCTWMRCPHGCEPDRWLSQTEVEGLFQKVLAIQSGSSGTR
jgi:putative zinc- or iron-chelating protein